MDVLKQITDDLQQRKAKAQLGGGPEKIEAQHKKGLLTARERIEKLVDSGTFMELGMLNTSDVKGVEDKSYGDGLIAGIGKVNGRPAKVF
jgi:methylmalonyl-CoA decarboxylase subunit alpha